MTMLSKIIARRGGGGVFSHLQLVAPGDISILAIWSSESLVQRQEL